MIQNKQNRKVIVMEDKPIPIPEELKGTVLEDVITMVVRKIRSGVTLGSEKRN